MTYHSDEYFAESRPTGWQRETTNMRADEQNHFNNCP